jgi:hypothetical protein
MHYILKNSLLLIEKELNIKSNYDFYINDNNTENDINF